MPPWGIRGRGRAALGQQGAGRAALGHQGAGTCRPGAAGGGGTVAHRDLGFGSGSTPQRPGETGFRTFIESDNFLKL